MVLVQKLTKEEYKRVLELLDELDTNRYIDGLNNRKKLVQVLKNGDKILNIVLFGFGEPVHKLQRFYYTHVYVILPYKYWLSCDGDSSWRRTLHNLMIDLLVLKYPQLQSKVETIVLLKNTGYRIKGYAFFWESIGMNYNSRIVSSLYKIRDKLMYFEVGREGFKSVLVLNMRGREIVLKGLA